MAEISKTDWLKLEQAALAFDDWGMPWLFKPFVCGKLYNSAIMCEAFEAIWICGSDYANWQSSDLAECARVAAHKVKDCFPSLAPEVADLIVRAISYDWR